MAKKTTKKKSSKKRSSKSKAVKAKPAIKKTATKREKHPYHHHIRISLLVFAILTVILIISTIASYPKFDHTGTADIGDAIATVNGEGITQAMVDAEYAKIPEAYQAMVTDEIILDQIINEMVLLQEADSKGMTSTTEEVDEIIATTMMQLGLSEEDLAARLAEQGMQIDDLKALYLKQLKITKLMEAEVLPNIEVSDDALEEFYDSRIRARHILVNTAEEAEDIIDQLNDGADFAELAGELSEDPGSPDGDLGEFGKGQMVQPFEEAAYALEIGDITQEPVETQFGYHIIERLAREKTFEESKEDLKLALQQQQQTDAITAYIQELRDAADIEYADVAE